MENVVLSAGSPEDSLLVACQVRSQLDLVSGEVRVAAVEFQHPSCPVRPSRARPSRAGFAFRTKFGWRMRRRAHWVRSQESLHGNVARFLTEYHLVRHRAYRIPSLTHAPAPSRPFSSSKRLQVLARRSSFEFIRRFCCMSLWQVSEGPVASLCRNSLPVLWEAFIATMH